MTISAKRHGFPPSLKPGCLPVDSQPSLYCPGDDGYGCYKIPTLHQTTNGTLLAMIEARKYSCDDEGFVDLRVRRSFDQGRTWGPSQLVHGNSTEDVWTTVGDASMVADATTGITWLVHTRNNSRLFVSSSKDHGATWSDPVDITPRAKLGYPRQGWIGTGHAGGVQLQSGRLVVAVYSYTSYVIYSDDHGASWHIGGTVKGFSVNENQVALLDDDTLVMTMRHQCSPLNLGCGRVQAFSSDGGMSWEKVIEMKELPEPIGGCEGSMIYHAGVKKLFFSHPDPLLHLFRRNLVIWSSADHGRTWNYHTTIWPHAAGYSALELIGSGPEAQLGILYDRNNHTMAIFEAQSVTFTSIDPHLPDATIVV